MDISSIELFHFTEPQYLEKILKSQCFIPRYSLEYTHLSNNYSRPSAFLPIPMVCFCDIPLQLSFKHRLRYGHSGIVMNESWKLKSGLNPIIYIQSESKLAHVFSLISNQSDNYIKVMESRDTGIKIINLISNTFNNLRRLSYFLKQFENKEEIKFKFDGKTQVFEKRKFYDEREWRYIPFEADLNDELFFPVESFDNPEKLKKANQEISKYKLKFNLDDVKYLVVSSKTEKEKLKKILEKKGKGEVEIKTVKTCC